MMKSILSLVIPVVITLMSFSAVAAELDVGTGKWWRSQRVAERLHLSPEEINQLDAAFVDARKKMIELKGQVEIEQLELETLIENPTMDEPAAMKQYQKLEKARMDLGMERFKFLLSVRKIIGYDKFQELMVLKKMRGRGRNNR